LLTALIEARDDGDQLSDDELVTTAYLLILAGDEAVSVSRNAFAQISGQIGKRYSYCPTRRGREMDTISASAACGWGVGAAEWAPEYRASRASATAARSDPNRSV
jgi:hypothetical protein